MCYAPVICNHAQAPLKFFVQSFPAPLRDSQLVKPRKFSSAVYKFFFCTLHCLIWRSGSRFQEQRYALSSPVWPTGVVRWWCKWRSQPIVDFDSISFIVVLRIYQTSVTGISPALWGQCKCKNSDNCQAWLQMTGA